MRSKSITSKSIFGGYKKGEDIVTAALLHLMELGGPALTNSLFGDIGVETTTHVNTQVKGKKSIPDGELRANYHIYIESKIEPWTVNYNHNISQLEEHIKLSKENSASLLYITYEEEIPTDIANHPQIAWTHWRKILDDMKQYRSDFNNEVMVYLVGQFEILLEDLVFSRHDNIKDEERVLIVPGRFADSIAKHHGFYKCQYDRSFRPAKYIAFYLDKHIDAVYEITNGYERVDSLECVKDFNFGMYFFTADDLMPHTFMRLKPRKDLLDHVITHNYPYAYVRNQRYTSITKLSKARTTDDL